MSYVRENRTTHYNIFKTRLLLNDGRLITIQYNNDNTDSAITSGETAEYKPYVTDVVIGDKVKTLGSGVFSGCSNLVSVELPISLKSIGYGTFRYCSKLPNVSIPNVTTLSREAFANCSSITEFIVPSGVKQYSVELLSGTSVKVLDIPDTVTSFASQGYNCYLMRELEKVIISSNIPTIPINCFLSCGKLTIVIIKNSSCTLASTNAFTRTPMAGSGVGKIYVPYGYGDEFKERENWSTYENHIFELDANGNIPTE